MKQDIIVAYFDLLLKDYCLLNRFLKLIIAQKKSRH